MTWTILYAIGWLITAPIIVRALAHDARRLRGTFAEGPELDASDWTYATIIGSLASLFWPLAAPFGLAWILARTLDTWQLSRQDAAERRELGRRERQARIQQLERELGIGAAR